jgi:hypothetical protein
VPGQPPPRGAPGSTQRILGYKIELHQIEPQQYNTLLYLLSVLTTVLFLLRELFSFFA